jgi:phenylacetate-CoA ligase
MLNWLRKNIFIPAFDLKNKNYRLRYYPAVVRQLDSSITDIQKYQLSKLKILIEEACVNVPYYSELKEHYMCGIEELNDISKLPVIYKELLREKNELFVSKKFNKEKLVKSGTGGSTSSPVPIYNSLTSLGQKRACTLYFMHWFGYRLGLKCAYLWGAIQDFPKKQTFKQKVVNFLTTNVFMMPSSYLDDSTLQLYYNQLLNSKVSFLQAYPTPLYIFALFLEKNSLKLNIKNINVTAEYLYDYQREKIEAVFETKIFNWYGARELGHIATECREHKGLHINSYGLLVEVLKNGQPVIDEDGEIVITDLCNDAFPLIRYKTGDIGKLSSRKCGCGSHLPLLEYVQGRLVDTFIKRDGTRIPGVAFTNRIIKNSTEIAELQIIQKEFELFELNIVKGAFFNSDTVETLKKGIDSFLQQNNEYIINFVDHLEHEKSGKIRFCKCLIQQ